MRVCAVVVTYNRKELLRECINALNSQTRKLDLILVVDNASTDGTFEMVKKEFPELKLLRLPENQGGAGGFHEGMKWAYEEGYEWIWIMDDDALPEPTALERLLSCSDLADILVPTLVNTQNRKYGFGLWRYGYVEVNLNNDNNARSIPVQLFSFVGPLFKREVVERIGLPRKDFFISSDDLEWALRAMHVGFVTHAVPSAVILHEYGKTRILRRLGRTSIRGSQPPWKNYYGMRNHYLMLSNFPKPRCLIERIVLFFFAVRWSIGDMLYEPDWRKRIYFRWLGLLHGVLGRTGRIVNPRGDKVL